jgi:hypothetical protein
VKELRETHGRDQASTSATEVPEEEKASGSKERGTPEVVDRKTEAQRRFESIQKQRVR